MFAMFLIDQNVPESLETVKLTYGNLPTSITIGNAQIPFKQSVKRWVIHLTVILL